MVRDATHETKANPPIGETLQYHRRLVNECRHALFAELAAAQEAHVVDDVVAAVLHARLEMEVIIAYPDSAVGVRCAASEQIGLLQQERFQARLMRSQSGRQASNSGPQYNDIVSAH